MRQYKPREWPQLHKAARDQAAEEVAAALINSVRLAETQTDPVTLKVLLLIVCKLNNSLRLLEGAGAQTRPAREP
jgi:hypothetical protein